MFEVVPIHCQDCGIPTLYHLDFHNGTPIPEVKLYCEICLRTRIVVIKFLGFDVKDQLYMVNEYNSSPRGLYNRHAYRMNVDKSIRYFKSLLVT